jgi:hypothetical protein
MQQIQRLIFGIDRCIYGYRIRAEITLLKSDIHVLLTGGSIPHTGAVSMYCDGKKDGNIQPEGHKEKELAELWSKTLSEEFHCRATTVCGIHYDNLDEKKIKEIVSVTEEMLTEAVSGVRRMKTNAKKESK